MEDQLIVETIRQHADSLLRVARRYTGCAADAEDAYQRALEIFVRSAGRLDAQSAHKWLHTVCKNEALAVRRSRAQLVGVPDEGALEALDDGRHVATVEERSERFDELTRAAEALGRLKPQEVTALWLKAEGLSYAEIAERQGWTYTKVNRSLTEGRRAFLARYAGIESGAECERWTPLLSAIADGEASAKELADARPHLRNCAGCRALLAGMRDAAAPVRALLPPVAAAPLLAPGPLDAVASESSASLLDRLGGMWLGLQERAASSMVRAHAAVEVAAHGKLAAATASVAVLAGGGAVAERNLGNEAARAAAIERPAPAPPDARPATDPRAASDPRPLAAGEAAAAEGARGKTIENAPAARRRGGAPSAEFAPEAAAGGETAGPTGGAAASDGGASGPGPSPRQAAPGPSPRQAAPPPARPSTRSTMTGAGGEFGFSP